MTAYTPVQIAQAVRFAKDAQGRRRSGGQTNIHPDMLARLIWAGETLVAREAA
jgi:hypothetical protein